MLILVKMILRPVLHEFSKVWDFVADMAGAAGACGRHPAMIPVYVRKTRAGR